MAHFQRVPISSSGFPSYHMPPDAFRRHGYAVIDWIADYLEGVGERPVLAQVRPGQVRDALPDGRDVTYRSLVAAAADGGIVVVQWGVAEDGPVTVEQVDELVLGGLRVGPQDAETADGSDTGSTAEVPDGFRRHELGRQPQQQREHPEPEVDDAGDVARPHRRRRRARGRIRPIAHRPRPGQRQSARPDGRCSPRSPPAGRTRRGTGYSGIVRSSSVNSSLS